MQCLCYCTGLVSITVTVVIASVYVCTTFPFKANTLNLHLIFLHIVGFHEVLALILNILGIEENSWRKYHCYYFAFLICLCISFRGVYFIVSIVLYSLMLSVNTQEVYK